MNGDGRIDVVLSASERDGRLRWFETPTDPRSVPWRQHVIESEFLWGVHSLQATDIDLDADLDIVVAEMYTTRGKRVLRYLNADDLFERLTISRAGSHDLGVGDIDGDGDDDVIGENYGEQGRVVEWWESTSAAGGHWECVGVDAGCPRDQEGAMGLAFVDSDDDGRKDAVAGSLLYRNPGRDIGEQWLWSAIASGVDVCFAFDVDGDELSDEIGYEDDRLVWLEAEDRAATSWRRAVVGSPGPGHTRGWAVAPLFPGARPQMVLTRGKTLWALEVPDAAAAAPWPLHRHSTGNEEEGIATGDVDGDGDIDLAAVAADGHHVIRLENAGSLAHEWRIHPVGGQVDPSGAWLDRVALVDSNGNGRMDVVATEERQDGRLAAHLHMFEGSQVPAGRTWGRSIVARHRSSNSLSAGDVDEDGRPDLCVAEHTDLTDDGAADNLTMIDLDRGQGTAWRPAVVERGPHSSRLGAQLVDLDGDRAPEIVSIAWHDYRHVHLWKQRDVFPAHGSRESPNQSAARLQSSRKATKGN